MDPLSDVLSLLRPRTYAAGGFGSAGGTSIAFPKHDGIKCYAVVFGEIWLVVEDVAEPVRLITGDCFLLPRGRPFHLTTDLDLEPVDYRTFLASRVEAEVALDDGAGSFIVGGHFALGGGPAEVLLSVLPPVVHIRKEADKAALRWSMERMMQELRDPAPGSVLVLQHLAQMMLVQALRAHLAEGIDGGVGWLFALSDKQMGAAISALHADPAHRWTLQALAERAGMSRSTFALKFKATVGSSPMDYLTRWRMLLAGDRLSNSGDPISVISPSLGYESESAFSTAFKRVMGCSPRQYGRRRTHAPLGDGPRLLEAEPLAA
jgi:AraC-like DNA-binding protein